MRRFFPFLLCTLLLAGCRTQPSGNGIFRVDLDSARPETEANQILSLQSEVRLDPEIIVGDNVQLQVTRDRILVGDRRGTLYIADRSGRLLNTISRRGNGPGEYLTLANFHYYEDLDRIEIHDGLKNRLLRYTPDGEFLDAVEAEFRMGFGDYIRDGDSYWFNHSYRQAEESERFCLLRTNDKLEIVERQLPYEEPLSSTLVPRRFFWNCDGKIRFYQIYDQAVYDIAPGEEPREVWRIDFGKYGLNRDELFTALSGSTTGSLDLSGAGVCFMNASETPGQICLDFLFHDQNYLVGISKLTGRSVILTFSDNLPSEYTLRTTWEDQFVALDNSDPDALRVRFFRFNL